MTDRRQRRALLGVTDPHERAALEEGSARRLDPGMIRLKAKDMVYHHGCETVLHHGDEVVPEHDSTTGRRLLIVQPDREKIVREAIKQAHRVINFLYT